MKYKTVTLSVEDWECVANAVDNYWDKGPCGEGWQSDELENVCGRLLRELDKAEEVER